MRVVLAWNVPAELRPGELHQLSGQHVRLRKRGHLVRKLSVGLHGAVRVFFLQRAFA
jgi:hypothetical protein